MKKYLVITNNENYYLIEAISSMSAANQKCREYYRFN